jgi:hypothetical protein
VQVRRLSEAGWGNAAIRRILADQGVDPIPTLKTIRMWIDPDYADQVRAETRQRMRQTSPMTFRWPGPRSVEWRVRRIKVLADAGLTKEAIAKVMTHDFPDCPLSRAQIDGILRQGRIPWALRKVGR